MANIVIIGAGVMGSALAVPASVKNKVSLVGTMLDDDIVNSIRATGRHPDLDVTLPHSISVSLSSDANEQAFQDADVVVLGVSSPGVAWALSEIRRYGCQPELLALVTKGLVPGIDPTAPPRTYAQYIDSEITSPSGKIVGIGGPCIARELALNYPTRVSFASHDISAANSLRNLLQTDTYRVTTSDDITGLEACAALKNFMCIGVSAMFSAYQLDDGHAKNPIAGLFNQAVHEIALLSQWIVGNVDDSGYANSSTVLAAPSGEQSNSGNVTSTPVPISTAFDLAGMGDLHVTVGGGRNSRLGRYLGTGESLQQILQTTMRGVTVEGVDTGRQLATGFRHACNSGELDPGALPLTGAILDSIEHDASFNFNFKSLPG